MKLKSYLLTAIFCALSLSSCEKETTQENRSPEITVLEYSAPEDSSPVDIFATIQAFDPDADALSFEIVTNDNDLFVISDRGDLSVANGKNLDYSTATSHEIVISVSDGTETVTATITINVINSNQAPLIEAQEFEVYEDASSTDVIGTINAEDPDGDDLTYSIVANDNDLFAVNNSTGEILLADDASLDYETATTHEITVEVSDGNENAQGVITIVVENIPDAPYALDKTSFVINMETTVANEELEVGTDEYLTYKYIIDWGDGTVEEIDTSMPPKHTYEKAGIHTIAINGEMFPRILFYNSPSDEKVKSIVQWGTIQWGESLQDAFHGCGNLEYEATDKPNLSGVTNLRGMFYHAYLFNGDIGDWDVSNVTFMYSMFLGASSFNQDLSNWDVSNVTNMGFMFSGASAFDQNLGSWEITGLNQGASMEKMFNNSGLSRPNYEATLSGWAAWGDDLTNNVTLDAIGVNRCATEAYNYLVNTKQWTISDSGCDT
ncbi:BspA family leucine-rich repeat surface protein [Flagellimonas myxillae]|uniref:BspA family leucine-rich repeat surface protein n=1 Tax=Flagellimonas myxillae TaxID=2942214 RepID=UPI00201E866B|nr:BspA family leucine-rich repeat surface protein [Muricauda myxillae]MCL6266732.1 BspA family leucine-rich repeat surface protein [Muricauda myxillae]